VALRSLAGRIPTGSIPTPAPSCDPQTPRNGALKADAQYTPALVIMVLALLVHATASVRPGDAILRPTVVALAIALLPSIGLLNFRALESWLRAVPASSEA